MSLSTLLFCLAGLVHLSIAGYVLEDDYSPSNFFSQFSFFTGADPTHGFVQYVDQSTAQSSGLISQSGSSVYMGVDHTNVTPGGRSSVRITSNKVYNHGLIVLDVAHMPQGCGTWPAFWLTGPNWPYNGEIDIIEGVNNQATNSMTLHTGPGCSITNNGLFSGTIATSDCNVNDPLQPTNAGCSIGTAQGGTYGAGLNAAGGGVYATEWTSSGISIFFFPRNSIPSDIASGSPNPSSWGTPLAMFQGGCNIDSNIKDQQIVFDTTFCGDWAGGVWGSSSCASLASTCNAFVQNNPSAFANAFWKVNSLKVYQDNGQASTPDPKPVHHPHKHPAPHRHHHHQNPSPAESTSDSVSLVYFTSLPTGAPSVQATKASTSPSLVYFTALPTPSASTVALAWSNFQHGTVKTVTQNVYKTVQVAPSQPTALINAAQVTPAADVTPTTAPAPTAVQDAAITYTDDQPWPMSWLQSGIPTNVVFEPPKRMHARHLIHHRHGHAKRAFR